MSRGGRGGGIHFGLEIDQSLEDQVAAFRNEMNGDDDWAKTLYPDTKVHMAPPPTAKEKKLVDTYRKHRNIMRNGPLFIDAPKTGKRDAAEFNAFEDVPTYGNKRAKRTGGLPNLKKVPIVKDFMPRELWSVVSDGEEENGTGEGTKKNLAFLKKKRLDKLAQFDEGADTQAAGEDGDDDNDEIDEEDRVEDPVDDDFSEDESDMGNDYNAEQYFDNGDGVDDDGDDAGGDDACEENPFVSESIDAAENKQRESVQAHKRLIRHGKHYTNDVFDEKARAIAASEVLEEKMFGKERPERDDSGIKRTWEQKGGSIKGYKLGGHAC